MKNKASIFLLIAAILPGTQVARAASDEVELRDALAKNNWPELVLLLGPKKGQNFERDLILAKALLQLERRAEALKILGSLAAIRKDERVQRAIEVASSIFFNQETSNLYYEGVSLLSLRKPQEAKERFDQANAKEPGHPLILTRLVQSAILLSQVDSATQHLKEALLLVPSSFELRFFSVKLSVLREKSEDLLPPLKRPWPALEVPFVFCLESLKRSGREDELKTLAQSLLTSHPAWVQAQVWFYRNVPLAPALKARYKMQIDRGLKSRDRFEKAYQKEMSQTQYFWIGHTDYDALVNYAR